MSWVICWSFLDTVLRCWILCFMLIFYGLICKRFDVGVCISSSFMHFLGFLQLWMPCDNAHIFCYISRLTKWTPTNFVNFSYLFDDMRSSFYHMYKVDATLLPSCFLLYDIKDLRIIYGFQVSAVRKILLVSMLKVLSEASWKYCDRVDLPLYCRKLPFSSLVYDPTLEHSWGTELYGGQLSIRWLAEKISTLHSTVNKILGSSTLTVSGKIDTHHLSVLCKISI